LGFFETGIYFAIYREIDDGVDELFEILLVLPAPFFSFALTYPTRSRFLLNAFGFSTPSLLSLNLSLLLPFSLPETVCALFCLAILDPTIPCSAVFWCLATYSTTDYPMAVLGLYQYEAGL
jgi:hypothetical protein